MSPLDAHQLEEARQRVAAGERPVEAIGKIMGRDRKAVIMKVGR